jgi:hypothetical protein
MGSAPSHAPRFTGRSAGMRPDDLCRDRALIGRLALLVILGVVNLD